MPSAAAPVVLAHAGAGATWQSLVTLASLGVAGVFVLAVLGRVRLRERGDLTLPLAGVAVVASAAPVASAVLSDWVGWAFPVGAVALLALFVAASTELVLAPRSPLTYASVAVAAVAAVALYGPIVRAWHPPIEYLPVSDDAVLRVTAPGDGASVDAGTVTVEAVVTGATIGPPGLDEDALPADPEALGQVRAYLDDRVVPATVNEVCPVAEPCTAVSFDVEVEPGEHELVVEYVRGDGYPLSPPVSDATTFTAE